MSDKALSLILNERERQREVEKFDNARDDKYLDGELTRAGFAYLSRSQEPIDQQDKFQSVPVCWPDTWDKLLWWKPTTRLRNLEKAGALFQADIERLLRLRQDVIALMDQELNQLAHEGADTL